MISESKVRIILGSSSSSRRQLMNELAADRSFTYDVVTADIDEKAIRHDDPQELVVQLAHAKADAILQKLKDTGDASGLLITCDQVVVHEKQILEKPEDADEARQMIRGYARAPASTVGSVLCTDLETGNRSCRVDIAHIHFTPIPEASMEALIEEGEIMWCAGGLMVEHPLVVPHVTKLEGGIDSVMGLKKETVLELVLEALENRKTR